METGPISNLKSPIFRYRVNMQKLKPIHDWVIPFERYWSESFDRLDEVLHDIQK